MNTVPRERWDDLVASHEQLSYRCTQAEAQRDALAAALREIATALLSEDSHSYIVTEPYILKARDIARAALANVEGGAK